MATAHTELFCAFVPSTIETITTTMMEWEQNNNVSTNTSPCSNNNNNSAFDWFRTNAAALSSSSSWNYRTDYYHSTTATTTTAESRDDCSIDWARARDKNGTEAATRKSPKKPSSKNSIKSKWDNETLAGILQQDDVLLGPRCIAISAMSQGTSFYLQLLNMNRRTFQDLGHYSGERHMLVQTILGAIWEKDGRFLTFDETTGILAMVPNDKVQQLVLKDLRAPPKVLASKNKSKKSASAVARKKKLRQQKAVATAAKKPSKKQLTPKKKSKSSTPKKKKAPTRQQTTFIIGNNDNQNN